MKVRSLFRPPNTTTPNTMDRDCTHWQEYDQALKDLANEPIIGSHRIGELNINVTHLRWEVKRGKLWRKCGSNRTGQGIRLDVGKAVRQYLRDHNIYAGK
ncbi:MAG: hypothetical protein KIT10_14450 [Flavobacteriales bacterium]|nr:hypothetical protein [Flavobacteriales bacterium]